MTDQAEPLLPGHIPIPIPDDTETFRFEVLSPAHNNADLEAWSTSIDQIKATPGFVGRHWPDRVYTPEENEADLAEHFDHHQRRIDFAWTVIDATKTERDEPEVIGCAYLKPAAAGDQIDGIGLSWVRASHAHLDQPLRRHLAPWFRDRWPITIAYQDAQNV